jgi:diphthine-ammonia ligase
MKKEVFSVEKFEEEKGGLEKKGKTGVLFSGGKDSCLALYKYGKEKVDCLLSVLPKSKDSFMFHKPDLQILKIQAKLLNLPLIVQETNAVKEKELADLKKLVKKSKVTTLVIGGLASCYQATRIKKICSDLNINLEIPLWQYDANDLWNELVSNGFKVILTKISCEGIPKEFIGRVIGIKELEKLVELSKKYKFRIDFEGGEAETTVIFMPGWEKELKLNYSVQSEGQYRHFLKIKKIKEVEEKQEPEK